jgi:hypothetical protein
MKPTGTWRIPVGAIEAFGFRWHGEDLPTGVTIISATKSVNPETGLTVVNPVVNATSDGVYFWVTATKVGSYYVTIVAIKSDGGHKVEVGLVEVVSIPTIIPAVGATHAVAHVTGAA